jgi:hypothetical protein
MITMKIPTSKELQAKYWPTLEAIERLVERWRLWQIGRGKPLTEMENLAFWAWANHIVRGRTTQHFSERQAHGSDWTQDTRNEKHARRLDAFLQFLLDPRYAWPKNGEHRSPGWLVTVYRRRYSEFETIGEMKDYGISVDRPQFYNDGSFLGYWKDGDRNLAIRHWTECARVERQWRKTDIPIERLREVWEEDQSGRGRSTSTTRYENFRRVFAKYLALKQLRHNDLHTPEVARQEQSHFFGT